MTRQETRIVMLSMAVTLLGGWATTVEAGGRAVPECESGWVSVGIGTCPHEFDQITKCNEGIPSNCFRMPQSCENRPTGYTLYCTATEIS